MFLARKRIAWETYLDIPIGLEPWHEPGTGTAISRIVLGKPRSRSLGPVGTGPWEGWLVILGISNPGRAHVRGADFSIPLTFTFPGREIHATQISPAPTAPSASPAPHLPAARVSIPNGRVGRHGARLEFGGDFLLRPGDSCSVTLILSGHPAPSSRRIQHQGALTSGKIITTPGTRPHQAPGKLDGVNQARKVPPCNLYAPLLHYWLCQHPIRGTRPCAGHLLRRLTSRTR